MRRTTHIDTLISCSAHRTQWRLSMPEIKNGKRDTRKKIKTIDYNSKLNRAIVAVVFSCRGRCSLNRHFDGNLMQAKTHSHRPELLSEWSHLHSLWMRTMMMITMWKQNVKYNHRSMLNVDSMCVCVRMLECHIGIGIGITPLDTHSHKARFLFRIV